MNKFLLVLGIIFLATSCGEPNVASSEKVPTDIVLTNNFLGLHGNFHQGKALKMKYTISIDNYIGDGKVEANGKTVMEVRDNKDNDQDNLTFKNVPIPKEGSFLVSVSVDAIPCFKHVSSNSCGWNHGRVLYRDVTAKYNSKSPPKVIYVTPTLAAEY